MDGFLIEKKMDRFQKSMIAAMTDVWLEEDKMRKALQAEMAARVVLEERLRILEQKFKDHDKYGDWCPHTGR